MKKSEMTREIQSSSSQLTKKQKYDLPTLDEQRQLNQVDIIMKQNLISLQVTEMLTEVRPEKGYNSNRMTSLIASLVEILKKNSAKFSSKVINSKWIKKHDMTCIRMNNYAESEISLTFEPPVSVEQIGSYSLQTMTSPYCNLDIAVVIPSNCFEERDILNYIVFDKKKLYLAVLLKVIKDAISFNQFPVTISESDLSLAFFKGDCKKPHIIIDATIKGWPSPLQIRIIPVITPNTFKVVQLNQLKNNVRPLEWLEAVKQATLSKTSEKLDASVLPATPQYNNSIAEDAAYLLQHKILMGTCSICPVARDIMTLVKVWLTQRDMRFGFDAFDSHSSALLVAYLVQTKQITSTMSPISGFQVLMKYLAGLKACIVLNFNSTEVIVHKNPLRTVTAGDDNDVVSITLLHPLGTKEKFIEYNAFWRVNPFVFSALRDESRNSLHLLQSQTLSPITSSTCNNDDSSIFRRLFLEKSSLVDREDLLFQLVLPSSLCPTMRTVLAWEHISREFPPVLRQGLNDRIKSLRISSRNLNTTSDNKDKEIQDSYSTPMSTVLVDPDCVAYHCCITVGITLNNENASRKVDRGPNNDEEENFRNFWGSKCQLRRFQDGSIVEAVVWEGRAWTDAYCTSGVVEGGAYSRGCMIVGEITKYLLASKFSSVVDLDVLSSPTLSFEESQILSVGDGESIGISNSISNSNSNSGIDRDIIHHSRKAVESLDSLRTVLVSSIKGMPIMIENLSAIDLELRYTSLYPPLVHPIVLEHKSTTSSSTVSMDNLQGKVLSLLAKPFIVIGKLESSGKWPTEPAAVVKLKAALLLKLMDQLNSQFQVSCVIHRDCLDIFWHGYIFRLVILSERESTQAIEHFNSICTYIPRNHVSFQVRLCNHHQSIRALVSAYPCFADTVRHTLQWVANNSFTGLLSHEVVELVVASVFIDPFPKLFPPTTSSSAFLHVLRKISTFEWSSTPLVIDFDLENRSITSEDMTHINQTFTEFRNYHSMKLPIYIVASFDKERNFAPFVWDYDLSRTELNIIVSSSKYSYMALRASLSGGHGEIVASSFVHPFLQSRCNVVLRFNKELVKKRKTVTGLAPAFATVQTFKNTSAKSVAVKNLIVRWSNAYSNFIQEEIVDRLRQQFGQYALFFWNGLKGDCVNIIWKPSSFLPKKLSILDCSARVPIDSTDVDMCPLNVSELIGRIISICDGHIANVEFL